MSESPKTAGHAAETPPRRPLPLRVVAGFAHWATANRLRMAIAGGASLLLLAAMFATWSIVAHLAVESLTPLSIDMALAALDQGRFDVAQAIIGDMRSQEATPSLVGGAMFVLGAIKAHEAEQEQSDERRSATYQIAARYLAQAFSHGVPEGRRGAAAYLLGKSLVSGNQPDRAIPSLEEALRQGAEPAQEIHALAVRALIASPQPDLQAALAHNEFVIRDPALAGDARDEAWLLRAETLLRLGRATDAVEALANVSAQGRYEGRRTLLMGRLAMAVAETLPADDPRRNAQLEEGVKNFAAAQRLDVEDGAIARQSLYWTARCFELHGDGAEALAQYKRLSNLYGDTDEGLAATLAEADYARQAGDSVRSLAGYRAVMQAVGNPRTYENSLLPLDELQMRLRTAYDHFLNQRQFGDALAMLDLVEPAMGRPECMELQAKTQQAWGAAARDQSAGAGHKEADALTKESRFHLRAAGRAYEDLARIRFATRYFTGDLWAAADCYFQGQSFSNAARLYREYLHHEARQWNDMALVRLGQAQIARGEYQAAIESLEQCIEIYPNNPVTHQARLEAARAYQQLGKYDEAERLLRSNLNAPALTNASLEWRHSLFALGHLLYERELYDAALEPLLEAVDRWPDDPAALQAKYTVARAYHNGAASLATQLREPQSENEAAINRSRRQMTVYLERAHATYLDVQKQITLAGDADQDPFARMLLRNCYMMQGSVLMELRRFDEARQAYQNVITLYQNDPVVLESFVQVANCFRRLDQPNMARGNLERAKVVLDKLPPDADFLASTNFNRQQWELLLDEMAMW